MVHSEEYLKKRLERKLRFRDQAKKNNVFKARRRNNFPKKSANFTSTDSTTLRTRGLFKVLPTDDFESVPKCSHGPCLLFEKRTGENRTETFFACAIYRNKEDLCNFKIKYNRKTGRIQKIVNEHGENEEKTIKKKKKKTIFGYGKIPTAIKKMKNEDVALYCEECIDVFANKHECVCSPIEKEKLKFPTKLLPALDEQNGESQFFFSDESLNVITSAIQKSNVDGVLCIGAPRIFETVRNKMPEIQGFMLDYDKRFAKFYPSKQFAQYSMLVDHFYDKNAEEKLISFFEKCKSVVVVCDPPFGLFMEPLLKSINKMKERFVSTGKEETNFYSIYVLPIFFRKYVLHDGFWMSDYRVTYDNHKLYSYPNKTIVRIFTNFDPKTVDLKNVEGYKFCEKCDRWVTSANIHCQLCKSCTSIEQGLYRHCHICKKCVKPTYLHCDECERCHLRGRCIH